MAGLGEKEPALGEEADVLGEKSAGTIAPADSNVYPDAHPSSAKLITVSGVAHS